MRRADEILVVEKGRVTQRGTEAELLAEDGPFRRLAQTLQGAARTPAEAANQPRDFAATVGGARRGYGESSRDCPELAQTSSRMIGVAPPSRSSPSTSTSGPPIMKSVCTPARR